MSHTFTNIEKLKKKVWHGTPKYNFNARLEPEEIETTEKAYGIVLPESYKQFLMRFNGGMILEHEEHFYTDMTEWEPDSPKRSSYYLFPLDEMIDKYTDLRFDDWLMGEDFKGNYPIIPICSTPQQELLFLVNQKGLTEESPVFASFKESGKYTCIKVATDFHSFLGYYIESDGFPALLPDDIEPSWQVFMEKNKVLDIAYKDETDDEIIERTTALMKLYPDNGWNYNERGIAYRDKGQRKPALADFNKSIELNDKKAFFYYCRGILILDYGSKRKALIDLDTAVKLDPADNLFLSGRADAFHKLGKLDKALADCNKILETDGIYKLALYVREKVYKAMGEDDLARADSDLIDELTN